MSSNVKSEVIIGTVTGLGTKFDDLLETARFDLAKLEGMKSAITQLTKVIERQFSAADTESDAGKFDLETKAHVKRYVSQCVSAVTNAGTQVDANIQLTKGKIAALEIVVKEAERVVQAEQNKMRVREQTALSASGEFEGPAFRRPAGIRPADPLSARRTEGEVAAVAAESVSAESAPTGEAVAAEEISDETPKAEA